jgi:ATP-dependent DNA helicase PIF1
MLNQMRLGSIGDDTVRAFKALERPIKADNSLEATEL